MSAQTAQLTLFGESGKSEADSEWKRFESAEGIAVRYCYTGENTIAYELPNGEMGEITRQSQSRWYTPFTNADGKRVGLQGRGNDPKSPLVAVIAAYKVREATLLARRREAEAAQARESEREAVEKLIHAATPDIDEHEPGNPAGKKCSRQRRANTLCTEPQPRYYEVRRIVPKLVFVGPRDDYSGPTFAAMPLWLFERTELTMGEKMIYARLATYGGDSGESRCSEYTLARRVGMSRKQVRLVLVSLMNRNLVEKVHEGRRKSAARYVFLWHPWIDEWKEANRSTPKSSDLKLPNLDTQSYQPGNVRCPEKMPEKKISKDESPAREPGRPPKAPPPAPPTQTRARWRGKESEKSPSSDQGRIADLVGLRELMPQPNGNLELWMTYYREDTVALNEAIGEIKNRVASGVVIKKSAAAALTHEYKRIRDERASTR